MKKNISIVGTVGLPACYGGFESLVENLTKYSSDKVQYHVYCSSKYYNKKLSSCNGAQLSYLPLYANGVQSIPYDICSLILCLFKKPDVTVILGVSGCVFLPLYSFLSKSKIITNIDGLEWKRDKWGKLARSFLKFSESLAVKYSDVIVADNQAIGDYVIKEYNKENVIIAYGGDHAVTDVEFPVAKNDYYLSLCRIEPENNVSMILESFSQTNEKLKFIGNWESSEYGRSLKGKYSQFKNIEIIDSIYDLNVLFKLRSGCKAYLHGHSAGGTNPSLVEAMHFSKPIFAFDCNFNRYSTEDEAFYFTDVYNLKCQLQEKTSEKELLRVAVKMKEVAMRRYTWEIIAKQYEVLYSN